MQPINYQAVHQVTPIELVRRFRQLRVLVIGDAMLDTYLEGKATRLCSEGPVPVVRKTGEQRIPGGAANTVANLHALNADVMFLGVVGRDIAGSLLRTTLRERGISDRWLVEDVDVCTLHKLRVLADGQYVVRFDEGGLQGQDYSLACQQRLLQHLDLLYPQCDVVVVSDYCYGVLSDALIERLCVLHATNPKIWLIDSKALQRFREVPASIVTPNYGEALLLLERLGGKSNVAYDAADGSNLREVRYVAQQLQAILRAECLAITLAEHGVFLHNRDSFWSHIPAHPVSNANDIGAGDSFSSALALALAAGGDYVEATRIGIDAAGIAVSKSHTSVVHHQELLQRVSLRTYAADTQGTSTRIDKQESVTRLTAELEIERSYRRIIVFTNGIFDILHAGHVQFLRQSKELGDVLVVGVNSDNSVRRRGQGRLINSEQDRMALVAALDMVDYVILFDEDTPVDIIRVLRPDVHVKGGDYAEQYLPEAEVVQQVGGRLVILPLAGAPSTDDFIDHVISHVSDIPSIPSQRVYDTDKYNVSH